MTITDTITARYSLCEEGYWYDEIEASSLDEALEKAGANVDRNNYSDAEGTIWIDVRACNTLTGEEARGTVRLDAEEPDCDDGEHDWRSPYSVLGGLAENPGVWGHGGGVIIREVCRHCGVYRVTDTWAQRPGTCEQFREVKYEEADASSLNWVQQCNLRDGE